MVKDHQVEERWLHRGERVNVPLRSACRIDRLPMPSHAFLRLSATSRDSPGLPRPCQPSHTLANLSAYAANLNEPHVAAATTAACGAFHTTLTSAAAAAAIRPASTGRCAASRPFLAACSTTARPTAILSIVRKACRLI